jgi:hypothetical protein
MWASFDEMAMDDGRAELLDDGLIEITFACHDGDEAIFKAKRDTSSGKHRAHTDVLSAEIHEHAGNASASRSGGTRC